MNILDPFIIADSEGAKLRLGIDKIHSNKQCVKILKYASDCKSKRRLARLEDAYMAAHLPTCRRIEPKFRGHAW